jgi:phage gp29-like protein
MDTNVEKKAQLTARIITDSLVFQYLPNPSELIRTSSRGLKVFDDMLKDSRVIGLFYDRRNATQNLCIALADAGNKKVNEYAARFLTEKNLRKWSSYLLTDALKYGFRPAELVWQKAPGGWLYIDALIGHDINKYRFDDDGAMHYNNLGWIQCEQPFKWIIHRTEGDRYNAPYGIPYMESIYWPWQFKKMGWEFWLTATERFAVPSIIAIFEQSDPTKAEETAVTLVDLIAQINSGSSGALANVKELKQIDMGGKVSDFEMLIKACDLQISYGMTGQALANSVSDTGTQALGTVQERTKGGVYENDSRALAYTVQKLIDMAIEVNFGPGTPVPQFSYDTGDYAPFSDVATAIDHGIPISKKALYSRYNLPEPEDDKDVFIRPATPAMPETGMFSFSDTPSSKKKVRPMILIR